MKIGIIVYSQTGNTFFVAEKLKEKLQAAGHTASVERLTTVGGETDPAKAKIERFPELGGYDALVFAAPVQAFSLARVMAGYMDQLPPLQGKKIALFTTKHLRFNWTGGNRAISRMRKGCESKGGKVCETGIVIWSGADRERQITDLVDRLSKCF